MKDISFIASTPGLPAPSVRARKVGSGSAGSCLGESGRPAGKPRRYDRAARNHRLVRKIYIRRSERTVQHERRRPGDRHRRSRCCKGTGAPAAVIGRATILPRFADMPRHAHWGHVHAAHAHAGHGVRMGHRHGTESAAQDESAFAGHEAVGDQGVTAEHHDQQGCQPGRSSPTHHVRKSHALILSEVDCTDHGAIRVG